MSQQVPLSSLLGQLVVALTIEVDDLFEQRMPHTTTVARQAGRSGDGPWLVSYVMWSNLLRHVDRAGTSVGELRARAAMPRRALTSRLNGLQRWGYITVASPRSSRRPTTVEHVVSLTPAGQRASATFEPLPAVVEQHWTERFGARRIARLRAALAPFLADVHPDLPRFLPVVAHDMRTEVVVAGSEPSGRDREPDRSLLTLLAQTLLRFTLDYEDEAPLSLPLLANVVRVLGHESTTVKEIPLRAGISNEAVSASINALRASGLVDVTGSGVRAVARLTSAGAAARTDGDHRVREVERAWAREGTGDIAALLAACEGILSQGAGSGSLMAGGLRPHEGAWRTSTRYRARTAAVLADPRSALPHHPMVLHRGGYPDGS